MDHTTNMKKPKYHIPIPSWFKLVRNEFYQYNPKMESTEDLNLFYLQEDLLQLHNELDNLVIDLGWYGDVSTNEGQFKLYQIKDCDWDNPESQICTSDAEEAYSQLLNMINSIT